MTELKSRIERYVAGVPAGEERHAREAVDQLREALATGIVRAAERHADGKWHANAWVKSGILLGFRLGVIVAAAEGGPFTFFDKDTWPVRRFRITDGEPEHWTHLGLHYLNDVKALESPERAQARKTPWRDRLAAEPWFKGKYTLFDRHKERHRACRPV